MRTETELAGGSYGRGFVESVAKETETEARQRMMGDTDGSVADVMS